MISAVGVREWTAMLTGAVAEVRAAHAWLSELDSACGDGDHGTTMLRAANLVEKCVAQSSGKNLQTLLSNVTWALMGLDGGATGPLLGSFFLGISDAVGSSVDLDARSLAVVFEGGLAALKRQSRAQMGDKSMLDALEPAVRPSPGGRWGRVRSKRLASRRRGGQEAVASTKNFVAKIGRARYLGEKTLGVPDPGATSVSLLFKGFCKGIETLGAE